MWTEMVKLTILQLSKFSAGGQLFLLKPRTTLTRDRCRQVNNESINNPFITKLMA